MKITDNLNIGDIWLYEDLWPDDFEKDEEDPDDLFEYFVVVGHNKIAGIGFVSILDGEKDIRVPEFGKRLVSTSRKFLEDHDWNIDQFHRVYIANPQRKKTWQQELVDSLT